MYLLIVLLPLLGAIFTGFLGRFLGQKGSSIFSFTCVLLSFLLSGMAFYEIGLSHTVCYIELTNWLTSGILRLNWGFIFDSLTSVMLIVVTLISSLVHLYSIKYMEMDPHVPRFMSYLQIFTFFMLVLITAENLVQVFLGWEGVGISSYLLVNFWHTRYWANQSALKALLVNRVGDFMFSLALLTTFYVFKSLDFNIIFASVPLFSNVYFTIYNIELHSITLVAILLLLGAVGKSAQLGLHTWLPDAMEGPTPVSALIHAATMVTAGVFLLIRCSPLIEYSPTVLQIMVIFGSLTAFFGSVVGAFQNDLKKIIAYSTCSQLGYMIFSCGLSNYTVSLFHLSNHAFFKALLFLCAGSVIHSLNDQQDIRRMGGLVRLMPLTYCLMLIGSLALIGFPFFTGFYSKDLILELSQTFNYSHNTIFTYASWLGTLSVFFTGFYSFRLLFLTFFNSVNSSRIIFEKVHESSWLMLVPLLLLSIGSIFIGYLTKDLFIGIGTDFWGNSLFMSPRHSILIEAEYIPLYLKWLPLCLSILGAVLAVYLNFYIFTFYNYGKFNLFFKSFLFLLNKKWYIDLVYNRTFVHVVLNFGYEISFKVFDRGFIELIGPYGLTKNLRRIGAKIVKLQSGQITHYLFFIIVGLLTFLLLMSISFYSLDLKFLFSLIILLIIV